MNRKERRANKRTVSAASLAALTTEAHLHYRQGRIAQARDLCHEVLSVDASDVKSLNLLGLIAQADGAQKLAVKMFEKALTADELNPACHYNLGNALKALNRQAQATSHFKSAIAYGIEVERFLLENSEIESLAKLIWEKRPLPQLSDPTILASINADLFFRSVLECTVIKNVGVEALLTRLRFALLQLATGGGPEANDAAAPSTILSCAIAQQCFLNEYVFDQDSKEAELSLKLRETFLQRVQTETAIPPLWLTAVASYFPLHALPDAERLLKLDWPAAVSGLVQQQLREPLAEKVDRDSIPRLTPIEHGVSAEIRQHYEENPYPRWVVSPLTVFSIDYAKGRTGTSGPRPDKLEVLVAGCGTGLDPIQFAQMFPGAKILAVDFSLASLAYARRKTKELGISNIEYAQADILKLATLGRTFDRINAVGVLHHLAEPETGWRVLLSILRPGGEMLVGLYSEKARRLVVEARALIAERGYSATTEDIRKCRREIVQGHSSALWQSLLTVRDFYTTSGCRDLLFHNMEHRFTIPRITEFLTGNGLSFQGFTFEETGIVEQFQREYTAPSSLTDLACWHAFESDHPDTFLGMYNMSLRKG